MPRHLARAMYDQLEDTLTSITLQLRSAIQADASMPPRVNGRVDETIGRLRRRSGWARQVSGELSAVLLDTLGLAATIEWHVRQFQKCTGIRFELTVNDTAGFDLPEGHAEAMYDMYGEALSNVARHSGASRVSVALTTTPYDVTLVVHDDGIGLGEATPASGTGSIAGICARARDCKGTCEVTGTRATGTTLTVSLPLAKPS
jgi:signal transduction histidine kinase